MWIRDSRAGQRRRGDVDGVDTGIDRREERRELTAGRVVRVQVDRQVEPLAQRRHQATGRGGAQQPGHVLDGADVRPGGDDRLGQVQVVCLLYTSRCV